MQEIIFIGVFIKSWRRLKQVVFNDGWWWNNRPKSSDSQREGRVSICRRKSSISAVVAAVDATLVWKCWGHDLKTKIGENLIRL
ncbi:hypothetical protein L484_000317 [Morus notabilis]|uniref:Uncharacterized protein n=1 Tax=Morus notabilis TaxID=981085 RepID=W9S7S1_9ROSA|nr:hypothetical protein L484_000728 [Morus notabilis]EXC74268.1 hypothetical protein L484_000317 [Morus notabilis]